MKNVIGIVAIVGGALLVLSIGAALVVLVASAIGKVLTLWLPFSLFEASILSLLGLFAVTYLANGLWRFIQAPITLDTDDDDDEWDEDEDDEDEDEDDERGNGANVIPSIPRWRQPLSQRKYEGVGRNEPCPCGSGNKYKYCHGRSESKA